jgi:hypothetical protein
LLITANNLIRELVCTLSDVHGNFTLGIRVEFPADDATGAETRVCTGLIARG